MSDGAQKTDKRLLTDETFFSLKRVDYDPFLEPEISGDNFKIKRTQSQGFPPKVKVWIKGSILPGMATKVISSIEKLKPTDTDPMRWIWLDVWISSPGGSVSDALKMGKYFREAYAVTDIPGNGQCLSSCVLVFVSGVMRIPGNNAKIGIHRPYLFRAKPNMDFEKDYQKSYQDLMDYLKEMRIPSALGDLMFSVPPEEMRILDTDEFMTLIGLEDPVFNEATVARDAHARGISSFEYRRRKKLSGDLCFEGRMSNQIPSAEEYQRCDAAIMQGKSWP